MSSFSWKIRSRGSGLLWLATAGGVGGRCLSRAGKGLSAQHRPRLPTLPSPPQSFLQLSSVWDLLSQQPFWGGRVCMRSEGNSSQVQTQMVWGSIVHVDNPISRIQDKISGVARGIQRQQRPGWPWTWPGCWRYRICSLLVLGFSGLSVNSIECSLRVIHNWL